MVKSKSYKFKLNFQLENIPSDSNNNEPNDIKYQIDSRGKIVNGICINNYDGDDQANDSRRKKFSTINVKNQKEGRSMDKTTTREKTDKSRRHINSSKYKSDEYSEGSSGGGAKKGRKSRNKKKGKRKKKEEA